MLQSPRSTALGFRLKQPARELVFHTDTARANFSSSPLARTCPEAGRLILGTMRSHDQWNTTIYSNDDRYRGVKNLRTLVFMNKDDMEERSLKKYDLVDITSFAKDGSTRHLSGFRAIPYNMPQGCAMGYMPELNALCAQIGDYSVQSGQPLMKHIPVEIKSSVANAQKEVVMMSVCDGSGIKRVSIARVNGASVSGVPDDISVEEPLQISAGWEDEMVFTPGRWPSRCGLRETTKTLLRVFYLQRA